MKDIRKEERPIPISFITQFQNDMVDKRDRFGDEYYDHVIEGIAELLKRWKKEKGKRHEDTDWLYQANIHSRRDS